MRQQAFCAKDHYVDPQLHLDKVENLGRGQGPA